MDNDRISKIYQSFFISNEFETFFKNIKFKTSWLNQKLNNNDILKLEEMVTDYCSNGYNTMFQCGFIYAWKLFNQCKEREFIMNEHLLQLFSTYKSSNYYNIGNVDIDFVWLKDKLDDNDYDELEKQTITIRLNSEEEIFMGCFKFAWGLFQELCNNNTPYED